MNIWPETCMLLPTCKCYMLINIWWTPNTLPSSISVCDTVVSVAEYQGLLIPWLWFNYLSFLKILWNQHVSADSLTRADVSLCWSCWKIQKHLKRLHNQSKLDGCYCIVVLPLRSHHTVTFSGRVLCQSLFSKQFLKTHQWQQSFSVACHQV